MKPSEPPKELPAPYVHGTCSSYVKWRCRCDACRSAKREYDTTRPWRGARRKTDVSPFKGI